MEIISNGKEAEKEYTYTYICVCVYVYNWIILLYIWN